MDNLSARKQTILCNIIDSYLATMQPVGSRTLTSKYGMDISAATIRNEMFDLEEMGYLSHPHTSAGRVPTDKGYRFYVDNLLEQEIVSEEMARRIRREYKQKIKSIDDLIEKTSHIVATVSREACIAVLYRPQSFLLKQVHLVKLDMRRILVIWVTTSGMVHNDIVDIGEDITEDYLLRIANFLNSELVGIPLEDIEAHIVRKLAHERASLYKLYQWANAIVHATLRTKKYEGTLVLEGRNYLLEKPEFQDVTKTRRLFELLDNKAELLNLLSRDYTLRPMTIHIGRENECHDFWDCSLISAGYTLRDLSIGTITILGPRRIRYSSVVALLKYMAKIMTDTVNKLETHY